MTARPPDWAEALLRVALEPRNFDAVSGDLLEEYRESILSVRGQLRADRWYAFEVFGYVFRSARLWAALFGSAFVARTALDWLVPTDDFHTRAAVSTYLGAGILLAAGFWAAKRVGSFGAGTIAGVAAAGFGALVSVVGAAALLAVVHDPVTMTSIRGSGGLEEVFTLPFMMVLPGFLLGTVGGVVGAAVKRRRPA
jgi:hypothetical protein